MGNLCSVRNALARLGAECVVTADADTIMRSDRVILPGVGNCAEAMHNLQEAHLIEVIKSLRQPCLGICVGMQVMCRDSEEVSSGAVSKSRTQCLSIFDAHVRRLPASAELKVPHMGWNQVSNLEGKLFNGVSSGAFVYYVHSFAPTTCTDTIATTTYGPMFSAALKYERFYGTQFHPEKSGDVGEKILNNFLTLC